MKTHKSFRLHRAVCCNCLWLCLRGYHCSSLYSVYTCVKWYFLTRGNFVHLIQGTFVNVWRLDRGQRCDETCYNVQGAFLPPHPKWIIWSKMSVVPLLRNAWPGGFWSSSLLLALRSPRGGDCGTWHRKITFKYPLLSKFVCILTLTTGSSEFSPS